MTYVNKSLSVSLLLAAIIFTSGGLIPRAEAGAGPGPIPLLIPIEVSTDDAEENLNNGDMSLASSDLELIQDGAKPQKIGLRFSLDIPVDATIVSAYIQFTVDETSSVATNLIVHGQAIANALTFSSVDFDISNRTLTTASVPWVPLAWNTKGLAGPDQQTPDLSVIVQEVVDLGAWAQGNYIAFIISGNGKRVAETFNGTAAPVLHVEYTTEAPVLTTPDAVDDDSFVAPAYTTGQDQPLTVLNGANDIVERNDSVGFPVAAVSTFGPTSGAETVVGALGATANGGTLVVEADGSFTYTPPLGSLDVDQFVYTLNNTEGSDTATVYISVEEVLDVETIWVPVVTGTDDAEENISSGSVSLSSSDLEMVKDGVKTQTVGVRFQNVVIPQGATIVDAYIQYTSDEVTSEVTSLVIHGQNSATPATFTTTNSDISNRPLTAAQVPWAPAPWTTNEQSNAIQATPNLKDIVQELIDLAGWSSGNAMAFITSGTGKRVAESFNGAAAPMLHVTFSADPLPLESPVAVDDGSMAVPAYVTDIDTALVVADGANDIVERNDDVGNPVAVVSGHDAASVQGGVVVVDADGSFIYTPPLSYEGFDSFDYTLSNGELPDSTATVYISVEEVVSVNTLWLSVVTGSDDAEEKVTSGSVSISSSDLEMVRDGTSEQIVGVRFQGLTIPQGASIVDAYLQFKVDETSSESTDLVVRGENSANAPTFTSVAFNISSRPLTPTPVSWVLPAWNTTGDSGADQQTPDLSAIVQEVISQGGWVQGNAIAFVISGTGKRVAESFNGSSAPELHVTYSTEVTSSLPPVAVDDDFTTPKNVSITVDPLGNDDLGFPLATISTFDSNSVQGGGLNVSVAQDGRSFTYTPPANFLGPDSFTYTISNGELPNSTATVSIEVENSGGEGTLWVPVVIGSDDAEEDTNSGSVNTSSSDLEMILDRTKIQIVGVRFQNINIPDQALITEAYIQYQVDEDTSEQTDLIVHGELSSNAATYNNVNSNISVRAITSESVAWPVPAWNTRGQAGPDQRTPDLSDIVQEIIDQAGWVSGNSIAFITSGTGNRVAESFNGSAAPELYLVYSLEAEINLPPVASNVMITDSDGGDLVVGDDLVGSYDYFDAEDNAEAGSDLTWYRDGVPIVGANTTTYVTVPADGGKTITFKVLPVAIGGSTLGDEVTSAGVDVFFELGGMGPAGGIVFYLRDGVGTIGTVGLEAAPEDQGQAVWGCYAMTAPPAILVGATGTTIGSGAQNTIDILANCTETGIAADVANMYELNGFTDWYLPATGEAVLLGRELSPVTNFTGHFWTSTENSAFSAFYFRTNSNRDLRTGKKSALYQVRPIRSFPDGVLVNSVPVASNVLITDGNAGLVEEGDTLTGSYTYMDAESDPEGASIYSWTRDGSSILGAISPTYVVSMADAGRNIVFRVKPVATVGTSPGLEVSSAALLVEGVANDAPEALNVFIEDLLYDFSRELVGFYDYFDTEGDLEGTTLFQWFRNGLEIVGEIFDVYVADDPADIDAEITFEVTAVALTGTVFGDPVTSVFFTPTNTAPTAEFVEILSIVPGTALDGEELQGVYFFEDIELDFEGVSTYQWFRDGSLIPGATSELYTPCTLDICVPGVSASYTFEVTPIAETGILVGAPVSSASVILAGPPQ